MNGGPAVVHRARWPWTATVFVMPGLVQPAASRRRTQRRARRRGTHPRTQRAVHEPPAQGDPPDLPGDQREGDDARAGDEPEVDHPDVPDGVAERPEERHGDHEVGEGEPVGAVGEERMPPVRLGERVPRPQDPGREARRLRGRGVRHSRAREEPQFRLEGERGQAAQDEADDEDPEDDADRSRMRAFSLMARAGYSRGVRRATGGRGNALALPDRFRGRARLDVPAVLPLLWNFARPGALRAVSAAACEHHATSGSFTRRPQPLGTRLGFVQDVRTERVSTGRPRHASPVGLGNDARRRDRRRREVGCDRGSLDSGAPAAGRHAAGSGGTTRSAISEAPQLPEKAHEQARIFRNRLAKTARHLRRWPSRGSRATASTTTTSRRSPSPSTATRTAPLREYEQPHDRSPEEHRAGSP